jgi:hypothetical protein
MVRMEHPTVGVTVWFSVLLLPFISSQSDPMRALSTKFRGGRPVLRSVSTKFRILRSQNVSRRDKSLINRTILATCVTVSINLIQAVPIVYDLYTALAMLVRRRRIITRRRRRRSKKAVHPSLRITS